MARLAESSKPYLKEELGLESPRIASATFQANAVYVLMPIGDQESLDRYTVIKDVCSSLGLKAARSDDGAASIIVLREIVKGMCEAEYLIFDLSAERPNVYFELGYAFGIGNHAENVLLIAKSGSTVHFDVAQLRIHHFSSNDDLRSVLSMQLARLVREGRQLLIAQPCREARPLWKFWNRIV